MRPYPEPADYLEARKLATYYRQAEQVLRALENRRAAFARGKIPPDEALDRWIDNASADLRAFLAPLDRAIAEYWTDTAIAAWVEGTRGLGVATFRCLSLTPPLIPLAEFPGSPTVASVWRYVGLHPAGARDDRRYSAIVKAWWIWRVAEPTMKQPTSPYRAVYLARRAPHDALPMLAEGDGCATCDAAYAKRRTTGKTGWDCANLGGPHWKAAHLHADALRVTAKAILRDAWRIAHDYDPRYSGVGVVA
jgi:hypothetical protein